MATVRNSDIAVVSTEYKVEMALSREIAISADQYPQRLSTALPKAVDL